MVGSGGTLCDPSALVWGDAGGRDEVEAVWLLFLEGLEAMTCLLCCRAIRHKLPSRNFIAEVDI